MVKRVPKGKISRRQFQPFQLFFSTLWWDAYVFLIPEEQKQQKYGKPTATKKLSGYIKA